MKREFLQNIKVGDQPLPKEVIDSILNETRTSRQGRPYFCIIANLRHFCPGRILPYSHCLQLG